MLPVTPQVNDVVQVLDTCGTPGYIGMLGYVKLTYPDHHNVSLTDIDVYTLPENSDLMNADVATITVFTIDLHVLGQPRLLPNE